MIGEGEALLSRAVLISLDHDLEPEESDGKVEVPACGAALW
jgi:hypothetical protein